MENKILYKNKNIFYRVTGKGEPVVLVHGFGEDGNIWNGLVTELEKSYSVIIPDLPGSGRSAMLEGETVSIDDYADVVKYILDKEAITSAVMIGHSMGGYVTLAFVERYSGLLKAFGLFHSTAFADTEEKKLTRRKSIEFIKTNGSPAFLKTSIPGLFTEEFNDLYPQEVESLISSGENLASEALIQYNEAMINRPDRTEVLRTFNKPILFLIGEKDKAILLQSSLKQCHLPSISHIHILSNAAHMGMIEERNSCNQIVFLFLTSCY